MNYCEHCDAKQGEFYVHGPDGGFCPHGVADMDRIAAERLEGPHQLIDCEMGSSGAMVDWRNHRHGVVPPSFELPTRRRKRKS